MAEPVTSRPEDVPTGVANEPGTLLVRVRYFAGARAAAGVTEERIRVASSGSTPATVADVIDAVLTSHDERIAQVVPACSFLLDGVAVRDRSTAVNDGCEVDVLPPFAGG